MYAAPLVPGKPSQLTWTGAGRCAITCITLPCVAPLASIRMSIWRARISAAICGMPCPCSSTQCSLAARMRWRNGVPSSGPAENSVTSKRLRSWASNICTASWLVACWWKSADR